MSERERDSLSLFASLTRGNILLSESWTASSRKRYGTMPMTSKFLFFQRGETRVVNNTHDRETHTVDFHDRSPSSQVFQGIGGEEGCSRNILFENISRSISREKKFGLETDRIPSLSRIPGSGRPPAFPALRIARKPRKGLSSNRPRIQFRPDLIKTFATMGLGPSRKEEKTSTNQSTSR